MKADDVADGDVFLLLLGWVVTYAVRLRLDANIVQGSIWHVFMLETFKYDAQATSRFRARF